MKIVKQEQSKSSRRGPVWLLSFLLLSMVVTVVRFSGVSGSGIAGFKSLKLLLIKGTSLPALGQAACFNRVVYWGSPSDGGGDSTGDSGCDDVDSSGSGDY